jgi:hypothetical protein
VRIIFSRKGFDTGAGGVPSPILDDIPVSIPIPTSQRSTTTYSDIGLGDIVHDLTRGRIEASSLCHHDPDLRTGPFGQVGIAQSHLRNNAVCPGDLFLFWGLFRRAARTHSGYRYVANAPKEHRIFGWLLVDEIVQLGPDGSWAARKRAALDTHPHCRPGWQDNNTLYLGAEQLRLGKDPLELPGSGVFPKAAPVLRLSVSPRPTSLWKAPRWLNPRHGGVGMTYHSDPKRWAEQTVQTVAKGQEFVASVGGRPDAVEWLKDVFDGVRP